MIYYSEQYEESWKCNFLGLSKFCLLPEHVVHSEDYILINIESPKPSDNVLELSADNLHGYRIELHTGHPPLDRASGMSPSVKPNAQHGGSGLCRSPKLETILCYVLSLLTIKIIQVERLPLNMYKSNQLASQSFSQYFSIHG